MQWLSPTDVLSRRSRTNGNECRSLIKIKIKWTRYRIMYFVHFFLVNERCQESWHGRVWYKRFYSLVLKKEITFLRKRIRLKIINVRKTLKMINKWVFKSLSNDASWGGISFLVWLEAGLSFFLMKNLTNPCKVFPIDRASWRCFFYLKHLHLIKLWL